MSRRIAVSLLLVTGLLSAGAPPQETCIDSQPVVIDSGGTNGVRAVIAVDLDGDGDADVVSASQNDGTIAWYERDGTAFTQRIIDDDAAGAAALFAIDMDKDGPTDVLAASANDDTIAWYENSGEAEPRFIKHVITTLANGASSVHAIDMDGDTDIDVVSASANDDTLAWYENTGNSVVFTRHVITNGADGAASVFAIDVDEDGRVDVVYAARASDRVAWCQNTLVLADPDDPEDEDEQVWIDHVLSSNIDGASSVFAVDQDEDGDVDVLSASTEDDTIAWFRNDGSERGPSVQTPYLGDGVFQTQLHFTKTTLSSTANGASSVFAIDVDGDGLLDVLSASRLDGEVSWYKQGPLASFAAPSSIGTSLGVVSVHARAHSTAPSSGADVVTAASIPGTIALHDEILFHENASVSPAPPVFVPLPVSDLAVAPESIAAVDLDGDATGANADLDLVVASVSEQSILWYESNGGTPPAYTRRVISADAGAVSLLLAANLDAPGHADVIAASDSTVAWYQNDGAVPPGFSRHVITSDAEGASAVFAADLDGANGSDVLVASSGDDTIAWYENLGSAGAFAFDEHVLSTSADGASAVRAGDLDGDTLPDVVYASANDDQVAWFQNIDGATNPASRFAAVQQIPTTADGPRALALGDIDSDGRLDVVVGSSGDDLVAWYQNTFEVPDPPDPEDEGEFVWIRRVITTQANSPRALAVLDLNDDDWLDVVVVSIGDDTVAWYEQQRDDPPPETPTLPPTISFVEHVLSTNTQVRSVATGDLDDRADATTDSIDIAIGALFRLSYHPAGAPEVCGSFDVSDEDTPPDGRIDGVEMGWLGLAFGEVAPTCTYVLPHVPWWAPIDLNRDCLVDGEDLAILTSIGVWGKSTDPADASACHFTCPVTESP